MKVGIVTFHAAYNYGAMLQNYALQQTLINLGHECKTLNLRTRVQKEKYDYYIPYSQLINKKLFLKNLFFLPFKKRIQSKFSLFENFLSNELKLTDEVESLQAYNTPDDFDCYIVGSDQCWNLCIDDFDWSFFLNFVPEGKKKLSYSVSMGGKPSKILENKKEELVQVRELLKSFSGISVREELTKSVVSELAAGKVVNVHVDPTLLLTAKKWQTSFSSAPLVEGKYILLYSPYYMKEAYQHARELSKFTGLKVIVTIPSIQGMLLYSDFKLMLEVGPWEFLNLVMNAEYTVGKSFHLLAFSIIFHKKMVAVGGRSDSRLANLLGKCGLESYACENVEELPTVINNLEFVEFEKCEKTLQEERELALSWLNGMISL